jgi:hypothetical protein
MLAMALFLEQYKKKDLSDADRNFIEMKWLGQWKEKLGHPAHTPQQVMQAYCEYTNITPDSLNLAMDWDCWPAPNNTNGEVSDLA